MTLALSLSNPFGGFEAVRRSSNLLKPIGKLLTAPAVVRNLRKTCMQLRGLGDHTTTILILLNQAHLLTGCLEAASTRAASSCCRMYRAIFPEDLVLVQAHRSRTATLGCSMRIQ